VSGRAERGGQWLGWIRRLGCGKPDERRWQEVCHARSEADCWRALERERDGRPWVYAAWTVLRRGEHPGTARRRRRKVATTRVG
jgi:hypothetical protein